MSESNRRLYGRAQPPNGVAYLSIGNHRVTAAIGNISSGGVFLRTSAPLAVGTQVGLEFFEPGKSRTLTIKGRVVSALDQQAAIRLKTLPGVGVEFEDLNIDQHRRMRAMIEAFESARPGGLPSIPTVAEVVPKRSSRAADPAAAPAPARVESGAGAGVKRRRNRRVPGTGLAAHVRARGEVIALYSPVSNLSLGGLFVPLSEPLPIGAAIEVELLGDGKPLVLSGDVVGVLTPAAAAERGLIPGISMHFAPMARRTVERLRSALITLAPLAADSLTQEFPPEGFLPDPVAPPPPLPVVQAPVVHRKEFDYDTRDLSAPATEALKPEDLPSELARLKAEVTLRLERIALIERSMRETKT